MTLEQLNKAIEEAISMIKICTSDLLKMLLEKLIRELEEMRAREVQKILDNYRSQNGDLTPMPPPMPVQPDELVYKQPYGELPPDQR